MASTFESSSLPRPTTTESISGPAASASGTVPRAGTTPRPSASTTEFPTNTNPILPTRGTEVSVLVTGATGTAGYEVLKHLCSPEFRNRFKVVAGVHHDHPGMDVLEDCDVVRHIDADDLGQLQFNGIDLLLIIPSNAESRVEQVRNYVAAAVRDGVKFILLLSLVQPLTEIGQASVFARQFKDMETIVSECGIPCAYLRCAFFMQSLLAHAHEIAVRSTLSLPIGRGSCAPLNVVDAARATCAILLDPATHAYKAYDLCGPEILSGTDIAMAASRALGRRINFRDCSADEFISLYRSHGVPEWLARGFFEILDLHASGGMGTGEAKTFYTDLTGHQPITIEQFFDDYAELFLPPPTGMESMVMASKTYRGAKKRDLGYSSRRSGRGAAPEYGYALEQGEELNLVLRELVLAKELALRAKYSRLHEEEEQLDRLITAFDMFGASMPSSLSRRTIYGRGGRNRRSGSGYMYGGGSDSDLYPPGPSDYTYRRSARRGGMSYPGDY